VGVGGFLRLPPAVDDLFAPSGSNVHVAPFAGTGATNAFTFTVETPATAYRFCVGDIGGFKGYGLAWNTGDTKPALWDSRECAWLLIDAGNTQVRLKSVFLEQTQTGGYGYLNCLDATQCHFTSNGVTAGNCACYGGSALNANQTSCDPVDGGRLYGVGRAKFIAANPSFPQPAFRFIFKSIGDDITVLPASTGPTGSKTIDMDDGTDTYRLCMVNSAGFRLGVELSNGPNWNDTECAWLIEDAGSNEVRLVNVAVQATNPGLHLDCDSDQDCGISPSTATTTHFVLDVDECAANATTCDPNADCTNTIGNFSCACRNGFVADGNRCLLVNACVVNNGACSQRCVGTLAGEGVCGCFPGFTLGADAQSCEPAQRMRLLNEGVGGAVSVVRCRWCIADWLPDGPSWLQVRRCRSGRPSVWVAGLNAVYEATAIASAGSARLRVPVLADSAS